MSLRVSMSWLWPACSGLMYKGVPIIWAEPVTSVLSVSRARPPVHLAADRLRLLRREHDAEAAFADLLEELVGADQGPGPFPHGHPLGGGDELGRRPFQECAGPEMIAHQPLQLTPQLRVAPASLIE